MANIKITDLTAYGDPASTDVLPIVDVGADVTKKVSVADLMENAGSGTASAPGIAFDGDPNTGIYSPGADQIAISTNGTGRLFVDASGNVGINAANPAGNLQIASTTPEILLTDTNGNATHSILGHNDGSLIISADFANGGVASSSLELAVDGTERARIDSSGRLLVGTSTAPSGGDASAEVARLVVQGRVGNDNDSGRINIQRGSVPSSAGIAIGSIYFTDSSNNIYASILAECDGTTGAGDYPGRLAFSVTADGASSPAPALRINNAGELLVGYTSDNGAYKLQVNSQIFATSATIATSDGRYKENVASLSGCLDLVKALRPVSFTWKPQEDITRLDDEGNEVLVRERHNFPEGTQVGFIAQEVQEVLDGKPWLGSVIKENARSAVKDNDGNELAPEEEFYGIVEGNLIAVLTNALQEATAKIEDLEARLTAAGL